jgi:hypothetical protein
MPGPKSKFDALSSFLGEIRSYIQNNGIEKAVRKYGDDALDVAEKDMIPFRADRDQRLKIIEARRKKQMQDDIMAGGSLTGTAGTAAWLISKLKDQQEDEIPNKKDGGWIQGAIKKPGALRQQLGVKEGEKIPAKKLNAAAKEGGKLGQRARLAKTLRGFKHGGVVTKTRWENKWG